MRVPLLAEEIALRNRALDDVARLRSMLITVCAWCSKVIRAQDVGDGRDVRDECAGVSHGICRRCDERMEREGNLYATH